ncbi:MAG: methyl-accepting chemotaxis protein [Desulfuromonadaceae bacterium]|nr:methyl-accepting chemotaxis protein [Desulfuromonadaceae bacterium]
MKISNKLMLNSSIILVLMAVIGASAVIGIKFIQKNIFTLTQKSTPYQIKTLDNQRALQAHASNLLKLAGSESAEEYKQNLSQSNDSLAEEINSANELVKLGSTSDYAANAISENTKSIQGMTQKRLLLQQETQSVVQSMRGNLGEAAKRLKGMDDSIRKLQQGSGKNMVTNIDITTNENKQSTTLASLRDNLKDLSIFASKLFVTSNRDEAETLFNNLSTPLTRMGLYVSMIKWADKETPDNFMKKFDEVKSKLTGAKDQYLQYLASHDATVKAKGLQAAKEADIGLVYLLTLVRMEIANTGNALDNSSEAMTESISAFSDTNTILILSSGLLFSNAVIDSQANYIQAVKGMADFDKTVASVRSEFEKIESTAKKLKALLTKGNFKRESKLLADSLAALATVKQGFLEKGGAAEKIKASLDNIAEVAKLNLKMKEMVNRQMLQSGKDVLTAQKSQEGAVTSVRSAVNTTVMLIFVIAGVAVLASVLLSIWISRSITSPVKELMMVTEGFGNGDFSRRMDESRKDEFGELAVHLNNATSKLGEITTHLTQSIKRLSESSEDLLATSEELHKGAEEQAFQTEQSVTAMTEITCTINDMAKNASDAASSSKDSLDTATVGKEVALKTVKGMKEISDFVMEASSTISKLSDSSEKIGEILNTINDIADQTNLLALNAAIEAARAGEQGRGFSVVADEVRKLAQRTGEATHEIAAIVHEIQFDTSRSVSAMNSGKARVEEGVKLSDEASKSLLAILGASERGVHMAQMISTATNDQSAASEGVSRGMEKIANITSRQKKSTDGIKHSSEVLSTIANELNIMASWFKVAA